jgi:hypothetical protein
MFDCVLSNPPYISKSDIETLEPQIRDWEPRLALDGGDDGLDCYRQIASQGCALLKPDGFLAVELGAGQFATVQLMFQAEGWDVAPPVLDLAGIERVLGRLSQTMNSFLDDATLNRIRDGGLVVYPTETIYGLGCIATNAAAVERLFEVKGREPGKPPPLLVSE